MLIYNKITGIIFRKITPDDMIDAYRNHYSKNLDIDIIQEHFDIDINKYYIKDKLPIMFKDYELKELELHGKILSEEERILESMKPSIQEIEDAEMAIRVLSILEGVL
ncbi:hypothetical protein CIW83_18465 [Tissierella sp. P1]|uniref:hypothetical protein n=1 Tax=Tissierella sp. P1 TaxID=1280483 RepID=UPI000B9FA5F1|nr:hypothetical protein [Tissierella sp. P1]OZV10802.1 hypothetical protein CIW83_18465 [Tissierella sp. P1]